MLYAPVQRGGGMHPSQCSVPPSKVEKKKKSWKHMVTSVGMCTTQLDLYSFVIF